MRRERPDSPARRATRSEFAGPFMKKIVLASTLVVLLALLAWQVVLWRVHPEARIASPPEGGDFTLYSWRGPLETESLRGKAVLIHFGYTSCPDVCPTNLAFIAQALRDLKPEERSRVQALLVSVDPERDSLERLREYTAFFHPDILGVKGTAAEIAAVGRMYGAAFNRLPKPDSALGYVVDHTANTYLLDQAGRLTRTLDHGSAPDEIRAAIREVLASEHRWSERPGAAAKDQ